MAVQDEKPGTDLLLKRAASGDEQAVDALLDRYRVRLKNLIGVRLDQRLAGRIDSSDVVQETLARAAQRLTQYAQSRPLPFYPWLRQLAIERLVEVHRLHIQAQRRTVVREQSLSFQLSDQSHVSLARQLVGDVDSPGTQLRQQEAIERAHRAIERLEEKDREVLVLRYLEQLTTGEAASILGISENAFSQRQLRAAPSPQTVGRDRGIGQMRNTTSTDSKWPRSGDGSASPGDHRLAQLIDELTNRAIEGEQLDVAEVRQRYPEFADQLNDLLPTIASIRRWGGAAEVQGSKDFNEAVDWDSRENRDRQLGDYHIIRELGRGGMGLVYEAEQISLPRRVALKILPFAGMLDEQRLRRFKNEARAAAMLKHPNIVSVYAVGHDRSVHFYAMELIDGYSLAEVIEGLECETKDVSSANHAFTRDREIARPSPAGLDAEKSHSPANAKPFDSIRAAAPDTRSIAAIATQYSSGGKRFFKTAAKLGIQAAEALQYAHAEGITHRDIKPANLLLDHAGKLSIGDFGLARTQATDDLTATGDLIGTLRYMSPEQFSEDITVGHLSDIYSLGLSVYEFIAGRPAFNSTSRQELIKAICEQEPPRLHTLNRNIPRDLETIIHKAIAKEPDDRYQNASQFADDLLRFVEDRTITARPTTQRERAVRLVRRNPLIASLVGSLTLLLAILAVGSSAAAWHFSQEAGQEFRRAEREALRSRQERLRVYARDVRLANNAVNQARFLDAETTLLKWVPNEGDEDLRDFEWQYLWEVGHDQAIEHSLRRSLPQYDVAFSNDGSIMATSGWNRMISVWHLDGSPLQQPRQRLSSANIEVRGLAIDTTTGDLITGDSGGNLAVWDMESGKHIGNPIQIPAATTSRAIKSLAVSGDGRSIGIGAETSTMEGSVFIWDRHLEKLSEVVSKLSGKPTVEFTGTGELLVCASNVDSLLFLNAKNGEVLESKRIQADGASGITVSPDGRLAAVIATGDLGGTVWSRIDLWDLATRSAKQSISLNGAPCDTVQFSPDGKLLAVGDERGTLYLVEVAEEALGQVLVNRKIHSVQLSGLAFSPNGSRLVTCGGDNYVHVWDVAKLAERQDGSIVTDVRKPRISSVCYVSEDKGIALADRLGNVRIMDCESQEMSQPLDVDTEGFNHIMLAGSVQRPFLAIQLSHWPTQDAEGKLAIWDVEKRTERCCITLPKNTDCSSPAFSHNDAFCVTCAGGRVVIIDVEKNEIIKTLGFDADSRIAVFSPGGRWLGIGCQDGVTRIFTLPDFELRHEIKTDRAIAYRLAFSPDERTLSTVGFDGRVKLFDIEREQLTREFEKTPSLMTFIRFSPNAKRILTGGLDGKLRVWMVESGEQLLSMDIQPNCWPTGEFSRHDHGFVISSGFEAKIYAGAPSDSILRLSLSELQEATCGGAINASGSAPLMTNQPLPIE